MQFRRFFIIQARHDGRFMTSECSYCLNITKAGKLYDYDEAVETARYHLDADYIIFSAYEPFEVLH